MALVSMFRPEPDVDIPPGDVERGARLFKAKCAQCHSAEQGGIAKHGPPLWGLIGREAGTGDFHAYSDANRSSGIVRSLVERFDIEPLSDFSAK